MNNIAPTYKMLLVFLTFRSVDPLVVNLDGIAFEGMGAYLPLCYCGRAGRGAPKGRARGPGSSP